MAGEQILPTIGSKGLWTISAPFNTLLVEATEYTCVMIQSFSDIIASGVNPREIYYTGQSVIVSDEDYSRDLANNVSIVCLSSQGEQVFVPTTYIALYPMIDGVTYTPLMVMLSLGLIRSDLVLSNLKDKLTNLVKDETGIDVVIRESAGRAMVLTQTQSDAIENLRELAKNPAESGTLTSKNLELQAEINVLLAKVGLLEQALIALSPP